MKRFIRSFGGGGTLGSFCSFLEGCRSALLCRQIKLFLDREGVDKAPCKVPKTCYNSDMLLHNYKERFNSCNSVKQHSVTHLFTSKRKAVAFTLAEVLITLGIIGVVAAITMPSLIQKYQEHVTVKKVQKFYALLSQAGEFNRTNDVVCEPLAPWNSSGAQTVYEYFKPFLKISKDCGTDGTGCSYTKNYHHINGQQVSANYGTSSSYYKVVLADGSAVMFRGGADNGYFGEVFYDANGEKSPNVWGKDMFNFLIKPNNCVIVPNGINIDPNIDSSSWNLAAWVVHFGNMDYLHCKGLSWDGAKSCKDLK